MLVWKEQGPWTPEILRCIHGDVKEYQIKQIHLKLRGHLLVFQVEVVFKLDCPVLAVLMEDIYDVL